MRSNVKKMWTALLAVTFVFAVGFGFAFAFTPFPGPRDAITADAVDGDFEVIVARLEGKTTYSYDKLNPQTWIYNPSSGQGYIDGSVTINGTQNSLWDRVAFITLLAYSDEACQNEVNDLRPLATETEETFLRYLRIQLVTENNETLLSDPFPITVTAAQPTQEAFFQPGIIADSDNLIYAAYTSFNEANAADMTVTIYYASESSNLQDQLNASLQVPYSGVNEEGRPVYGGYWIEYQDDEGVDDRTDVFEMGDTHFYVCYREAGWAEAIRAEVSEITVQESPVNAPSPDNEGATLSNGTYSGKQQSFVFANFETFQSETASVTYTPNAEGWQDETWKNEADEKEKKITFTATEAGSFGVTFRAKTGYRYNGVPKAAAWAIYRLKEGTEQTYENTQDGPQGVPEGAILVGVTYEWSIQKATIGSAAVSNALPDEWDYGTQQTEPQAGDIALTTTPAIGSLTAASTTVFAEGATPTLFYYSGTPNAGGSYGSTQLPQAAGEYTWQVKLSGMNNFGDFTGPAKQFTINSDEVALPALDHTGFAYDAEEQAPKLLMEESTLYGELSVTPQKDVGTYEATLELTDADNYKWAVPEEGSGIIVSGGTATYTWKIVKSTNTLEDLTMSGWTWNEYSDTANAPSATQRFTDNDGIAYTYHESENGTQIEGELNGLNVGTYWVKAVSAATKNYDADTKWLSFTVSRAPLEKPSLADDDLIYTGGEQSPVLADEYLENEEKGYYSLIATKYKLVNGEGETYFATIRLDGNHCWQGETGDAATADLTPEWTISPAEIGVEGALSIAGWTYGDEAGELQDGVTLDGATQKIVDLGGDTIVRSYTYYRAEENGGVSLGTTKPKDAGTYYVTVTLTAANNQNGVPNLTAKTVRSQDFVIEKDTLDFDPAPQEPDWVWGTQESGIALNGFAPEARYGYIADGAIKLDLVYYSADGFSVGADGKVTGGTTADVSGGFASLGVGRYTAYAYVEAGDNYNAGYVTYDFAVTRGAAVIASVEIEGAGEWTYLDTPEGHSVSVTVTVEDRELASTAYRVTYYTRGWNEGEWGSGGTLTAVTLDDGSSVYRLPEQCHAGYYYIGVFVAGTENYDGAELGYKQGESNAFTVQKFKLDPGMATTDREIEYSAGVSQAPALLIDITDGTVNSAWTNGAVVVGSYEGANGTSLTDDNKPQVRGDYYVVLTIGEESLSNYEWALVDLSTQLSGHEDQLSGAQKKFAFRITGALYYVEVADSGWTYGSTPVLPVVTPVAGGSGSSVTAEKSNELLKEALAEGASVTFRFYRDNELLATVMEYKTGTNDGHTALTIASIPDAVMAAGTYIVRVDITPPEGGNYEARNATCGFTVSPYTLTENDIVWSTPSDLTYRGRAFSFDEKGSGGKDITATYKNWTYENGAYRETESYLLLSLPDGGEIKERKEEGYSLNAALPEAESNVISGELTMQYTVHVLKRAVDVTLKEYHVTYRKAAFDRFDAQEGTHYSAEKAATGANTGLIDGEDLSIILTPSASAVDAGNYAYSMLGSGNDNYDVAFGNAAAEVFVIDQAKITVSIEPQASVYGNPLTDLTVAGSTNVSTALYTIEGELYDNANTVFSLKAMKDASTALGQGDGVGSYDIAGSVLTGEDDRGANYRVEFVNGADAYTIAARELKVSASVRNAIEYGDAAPTAFGDYLVTFDGEYDPDAETLEALLVFTPDGYAEGSAVGEYFVNVTFTENELLGNYKISYRAGTEDVLCRPSFRVNAREITVTIGNVTTEYGTLVPFEAALARVNGTGDAILGKDTIEGAEGVAAYANVFKLALVGHTHDAGLAAGVYVIQGSDVSGNYAVAFKGETGGTTANYTVEPKTVDVIFAVVAHGSVTGLVFDGSAWEYTAKGEGVNGEEVSFAVGYTYTGTENGLVNGRAVNAGSYTVGVVQAESGLFLSVDGNYQTKTQPAPFSIARREVTVTWTEDDFTYNNTDQSSKIEAVYLPWKEGAETSAKTLTMSVKPFFCDVKEGGYTFTAEFGSELEKQNYELVAGADYTAADNSASKVYTMKRAKIAVSIAALGSDYGDALITPAAEQSTELSGDYYTITGELYDNADSVFSLSLGALSPTSDVGKYPITGAADGDRAGNYRVTFEGGYEEDGTKGVYTIDYREVTVVFDDDYRAVYGTEETDKSLRKGVAFLREGSGENVFVFDTDGAAALDAVAFEVTGGGAYGETSAAGSEWTVTPVIQEHALSNYAFSWEAGRMTVDPRPVTVALSPVKVQYGEKGTLDVTSVTYTGSETLPAVITSDLLASDGETEVSRYANVFTLSLYQKNDLSSPITADYASLDRGSYVISVTGSDGSSPYRSGNYLITFQTAAYEVAAKTIGVQLVLDRDGHSYEELTYDGLAWGYIAYGDDGGRIEKVTFAVTYFNSVNGAASGEALAGAPVNAGSYIAVVDTGELDKDGNYSAQGRFAVPFSIARREVTVTWTEDDFTYNNTDQSGRIEAFYLPWENGAQLSEGSEVMLDIDAIEFKDVKEGGYPFTAKFASEQEKQNYELVAGADYTAADNSASKVYTMKQAEIGVTIAAQSSVYGEPLTDLTVADSTSVSTALYTITGELYDNADTVFSLTAMKDALTALEQGDGVGSYDIAGSVLTGEGGRGANYQVKFENADVPTSLVGTYAIERRPVRIVLQDFETIYGTNLSLPDAHGKLVTLSRLAFANGDDTTGSAILEGDVNTAAAAAEAMRFAFADGYGQTSAAGTKWTVTAGLADSDAPELKNYTFVTGGGSSSMTVIPRPVTVELPKPAASYTYGTSALAAAFGTFRATETIGSAWAEYGDAIVLNENAGGGVYTLVVKNENGEEVTLSAMTPAGSYTLEGEAGGNQNYAVTFSQAERFLVAKADFMVNDPAQEVGVTYTGEHYYFREEAASGDDNAASDPLFGHTLSVTTTGLVLDADDIEYTWTFNVASASVTYLTEAGEYTVGYTVKADNFNDVSGSFIVVIGKADNEWISGVTMEDGGTYRHAGWTYGDPDAYPGLGWEDTFSGYAPAVPFEARYGDPVMEYYKTRAGDDESGYTYSDKIENPDTFFCYTTQAGVYYVRVYVAETDDWKGLTAHGTIHVGQRAVDIDWYASNITVDPVTHEGKNRTIGFDNTLMTVDMHSLPQGLTIDGDPNDEDFEGQIEVTVTAEGTTQFYLFFVLKNAENYCWELSETVTGDKGERIQISFTTDAFQNNVVFFDKNGQADQNTGISVAYGTELIYRFAQSEGESIGNAQLLIFVDSTLKGETESSYVSFAFAAEGDTEPRDNSYTIASLSGADAGFYWLRVQVYPKSDSGYGYGVGYLKIEIEARVVTQAEIDGIDFGIDPQTDTISFVYDGTAHQPSEEHVPAYLNVSFDTAVTDVNEEATEVRAIFTIADGSYIFEGGAKQLERTLKVIVTPSEIERIVWSVREYTYNGIDQLDEVYAYFIDVFGHEHRLKVEAEGGEFLNAGTVGFKVLRELWDGTSGCKIENYKFVERMQDATHEYTMNRLPVSITLQSQTFVYSGGAPEIEQTAFSVNGFDYEIAETMGLYKELFAGGLTIAANSQTFGVGSYAINLGGYDGLSNYDVTPVNAQLTITPKQLTFRWPTVENDVFGGSIDGVTLTGEEFEGLIEGYDEIEGFIQVVYEGTSWSGIGCGGTLPKEAGEYTVIVRLSDSLNGVRCNYALADAGSRIYKIEKQAVEEPSVAPKTYTGEPLTADIAENDFYRVQTNAGGTDAGSYDVVLRLKDGANHRWATTDSAEVTLSFVIEKATLDVTVDLESWVFGEEGKDLILGGDAFPGVPAFRYTSTDGKGYDDWHMPENAGKYRVTVYIRGMDNYVDVEISCDFEIEAAEYAFTVTMEGWTYGERANAPVIAYTNDPPLPEPSDDIVRIEYAPLGADGGIAGSYLTDIPTDAGSYRVRVTVGTEGGNYVPVSGTADFTIRKAAFTFTVTMEGWTYGEGANAPVYDAHPEGAAATVEYAPVNGASAADVPADAGSYIVRVTYAESANYALSSASAEFVIAKAPIAAGLEMPALADGGFGWVAGEAPDSVWWFRDGFVPEGEVSAAYEGMAFDGTRWDSDRAPEKAGVYTLQVTIAESANHLGAVLEAEFTLTRGEFVFTVSVEGWTYGENANAPVLTCMTEELPAEAQVSYLYRGTTNGGEAYESKNAPVQAGSYTLTVTLTGMDGYADASAVSDEFVVSRAGTVIDTSGVRKQFVYTGKQLSVTSGATLNHGETQPVYSNNTFTAVGTYTVKIEAPGTNNYEPASATVTVTVSKAALGFTVSIDDWTYGETPSRYVISGLADGAAVTVWYSGLTNAGENYSSSAVPTEAGDYTIRAAVAASGSFEEGAAYDSFSILRADPGASLSLESWYYGDKPNEIVLTPDFLMDEPFGVTYSDGVHYSAEVPSDVGRYTVTVRYAQTDNYRGGELTASFEIMPRSLGLSVSIEGWTYGDEPNAPVVTGADLVGLVLTYTGTANDGTTWNSNTAPYKAGSYRLTVTAADADNYTNASASVGFTVARRLLTAPSWDGEGLREIAEEHNGGTNTIAVVGFDASLMNVSSDGAQFVFGQDGGVSAAADRHGIYEIYVSLKDTANYGWIVREDGGNATDTVTLVWQLTEHVISLLWLIILLAVLVLIALIILIVLLKKNANKKDGGDGGEEKLASAAPVGLLLAVAPIGQIVAVVLLGFVLAGLVAADIVLGVRLKKAAEPSVTAENNLSGPSDEA